MAFGFNTSKQSSQYTSQDQASSLASSLDTATSRSDSASLSRGAAQSTTQQSIAFEDIVRSLFGNATDAAAAQAANAGLFQDEAAQLFTGGLGFLDKLQRPAGSDYLESRVAGPDAAASSQIDALLESSGRLFNEQLMPAITSRGVSTGTLGGSRQSVSIGKAAGAVGQNFNSGVAQILANSQAARDAAAGTLSANSVNAAGTGLNALPSLLGLAGAGFNAGLSPYLQLSQILGSPTVLTQGQSTSDQVASAISQALSESFGTSQSESQSSSYSQGTSKGKSLGFSFSPGSVVG